MLVSNGVYEFVSMYCVGWAVEYEMLDCFRGWHVDLLVLAGLTHGGGCLL